MRIQSFVHGLAVTYLSLCLLVTKSCSALFAAPWTVACQAPLSMGFLRQEYWSGLPFLPPGDLPDPGNEPTSPVSPVLQTDSLPTEPSGKFHSITYSRVILCRVLSLCSSFLSDTGSHLGLLGLSVSSLQPNCQITYICYT